MRDLFLSERRFIRNTILQRTGHVVEAIGPVVSEYFAPPRLNSRRPHFNTDFVLRFVERGALPECRSFCARVMPNTMGAEVFVTVDAKTGQPLMTELDSGEAFSLQEFARYTDRVERELARLKMPLLFKECSYCRMFVIQGEVCFLAFVDDELPTYRGERAILREDDEALIVSYVEQEKLICVDGWMKMEITASDWHLVAEPVESA